MICECLLVSIYTYSESYLYAALHTFVLFAFLGLSFIRYREITKLEIQYNKLTALDKVLKIPLYSEEGQSIILNFIKPSDELLEEIKKLGNSITPPKT
jgi:hypothetical protein